MTSLALNPLNAESLIATFGLIGILVIVFAETGLLIGFFLPGDTLLFTAGYYASKAAGDPVHLPLVPLLVGVAVAAVVGAQTGYLLGRRFGPAVFDRPRSALFNPANLRRAEHYFDRFGQARAVVLARFIPVVRTFLNPVAGALEMPAPTFTAWNVVGGTVWSVGVTLAGYFLGKRIPNIDRYLLPVVAVAVLASVVPVVVEVVRSRRQRG